MYQANNREPLNVWRRRNLSQLVSLGMPFEVVASHKRFILAVQEAEDTESSWQCAWIADADVNELLKLLLEQFDDVGWDLVRQLRRRLEKA